MLLAWACGDSLPESRSSRLEPPTEFAELGYAADVKEKPRGFVPYDPSCTCEWCERYW